MLIQQIFNYVKENWIPTSLGTITAVIALITGLWSIDEHYAKAADLSKVEQKVDSAQRNMSLELQIQLNKQTSRDLKSKIADIEDKEAVTKIAAPVDKMKKDRLLRELNEINRETNALTAQKFGGTSTVPAMVVR